MIVFALRKCSAATKVRMQQVTLCLQQPTEQRSLHISCQVQPLASSVHSSSGYSVAATVTSPASRAAHLFVRQLMARYADPPAGSPVHSASRSRLASPAQAGFSGFWGYLLWRYAFSMPRMLSRIPCMDVLCAPLRLVATSGVL
jgi:hypothetical protein